MVGARVVSGQHYVLIETMDLETETNNSTGFNIPGKKKTLRKRRVFYTPDEPEYEFVHGRGLVHLETKIGMVAVISIGVAVVSSVILTAKEGVTLHKNEKLGYFQFEGSVIVVIFDSKRNIKFDAEAGVHSKMGVQIGSVHEMSELHHREEESRQKSQPTCVCNWRSVLSSFSTSWKLGQ